MGVHRQNYVHSKKVKQMKDLYISERGSLGISTELTHLLFEWQVFGPLVRINYLIKQRNQVVS